MDAATRLKQARHSPAQIKRILTFAQQHPKHAAKIIDYFEEAGQERKCFDVTMHFASLGLDIEQNLGAARLKLGLRMSDCEGALLVPADKLPQADDTEYEKILAKATAGGE